jgi:hypothetical protein
VLVYSSADSFVPRTAWCPLAHWKGSWRSAAPCVELVQLLTTRALGRTACVLFSLQGAPRRLRMHHQPDCSGLMLAHLPAPGPDSSLEFSISGATYDSSSTLSTLSTMVRQQVAAAAAASAGQASCLQCFLTSCAVQLLSCPVPFAWCACTAQVRLRYNMLCMCCNLHCCCLCCCTSPHRRTSPGPTATAASTARRTTTA